MAASPRRYTQQEIDDLIDCPNVVSEAPKREMKLDRGHFRNDMRLKSTDDKLEFRVFMRRNEDLPENFSIGLAFLAKDGSGEVVLLRCNGPHGGYNDSFDPDHPHLGLPRPPRQRGDDRCRPSAGKNRDDQQGFRVL